MTIEQEQTIQVAVIGSGLAGLTAAYLLSQDTNDSKQFEVHLFEKNSQLGMDAASISVGPEKDFRIDVPMRSFMSGYYSHLSKLYQHLKIPSKKANFSFGWYRIIQSKTKKKQSQVEPHQVASFTDNNSYLVYSGSKTVGQLNIVKSGSVNTVLDYISDLFRFFFRAFIVAWSYVLLMSISLWMHHRGHLKNAQHAIHNMTLGQFCDKYRFSSFFVHEVFVPLFAAVCTNSYQSMLSYPASDILEYMAIGLNQDSYVVSCGVQRVVENISKPVKHIHLETQITSILPNKDSNYKFELIDENNVKYNVNHIIFATQGNQAISMLKSYKNQLTLTSLQEYKQKMIAVDKQIEMLQKFNYDTALVINHTDTRLLPSNSNNWKALNLAMLDNSVETGESDFIVPYPYDTTMTTHILNMTHHHIHGGHLYMQTTNPCLTIDPKKILSVSWFERATVTLESKRAIEDLFVEVDDSVVLGPLQGNNGIWFVGSYCWKGIPLLEGCVASAEFVVTKGIALQEQIDISLPY